MNSQVDDYFTDVILDACAYGCIPIFWGTKNIGSYLNEMGILQFEDIGEFGDLSQILNQASDIQYESMIPYIETNLQKIEEYRVAEDWMFRNYPFLFGV